MPLYLVGTPIGNMEDITLRAIETLKQVDLIAAEDTRHSKILCKHYSIETPLTSYFEHNKIQKSAYLLKLMKEGKDVALVTDAGSVAALNVIIETRTLRRLVEQAIVARTYGEYPPDYPERASEYRHVGVWPKIAGTR